MGWHLGLVILVIHSSFNDSTVKKKRTPGLQETTADFNHLGFTSGSPGVAQNLGSMQEDMMVLRSSRWSPRWRYNTTAWIPEHPAPWSSSEKGELTSLGSSMRNINMNIINRSQVYSFSPVFFFPFFLSKHPLEQQLWMLHGSRQFSRRHESFVRPRTDSRLLFESVHSWTQHEPALVQPRDHQHFHGAAQGYAEVREAQSCHILNAANSWEEQIT